MTELVSIHYSSPAILAWDKDPVNKKRGLWCRQPYNNAGFLLRVSDLLTTDRNGDTGLLPPAFVYSYKGTGVDNAIESWQASTVYAFGDIVYTGVDDDTDTHYICVNAGTSGITPPSTTDLTVIQRPDAGSSVEWVYAPFLQYTVNSIDRRIKAYAGSNLVRWNKIGQTTHEQNVNATNAGWYNTNVDTVANSLPSSPAYRTNTFGKFNGTPTMSGSSSVYPGAITTFALLDVDFSGGSFLDTNGFLKLDVLAFSKPTSEYFWIKGEYNANFNAPNAIPGSNRGWMSCMTACWLDEYGIITANSQNYLIPSSRVLVGAANGNGIWMLRILNSTSKSGWNAANLASTWGSFRKLRFTFTSDGTVTAEAFDEFDNPVIGRFDYNKSLSIPSGVYWTACMTWTASWPEQKRYNTNKFTYG